MEPIHAVVALDLADSMSRVGCVSIQFSLYLDCGHPVSLGGGRDSDCPAAGRSADLLAHISTGGWPREISSFHISSVLLDILEEQRVGNGLTSGQAGHHV